MTEGRFGGKRSIWLPLCGMILATLLLGKENGVVIVCAIILHEGGHWLAAKLCHVRISGLRIDACGLRMGMEGVISYGTELAVAMGGPLVNLACWLLLTPTVESLPTLFVSHILLFREVSLYLGLFNLLPLGTMDGGRALTVILSVLFSPRVAEIAIKWITLLFLSGLWLAAAYALLRGAPVLSGFLFLLTMMIRHTSPDGKRREI